MRPDLPSTLVVAALATGCTPLPDPPPAEDVAACKDQQLGETGFDWSCCDVWMKTCLSEGKPDCEWICNG
ncbi:MAG: hypothetical protein KC656_23895 [Myxococcales bacterium]|nr:hypothetical protein [Myxococcales bacterium]MCB9665231.1 hypothetical protein [Alphaproteobacteria bacterium]